MEINAVQAMQAALATPEPEHEVMEDPNSGTLEEATNPASGKDKDKEHLRGENGVLRLLQEGHFKPNAEMHLREIFHRELSIIGAAPDDAPETEMPVNGQESEI